MSKQFNNPDVKNIIPGVDSIRDRRERNQFWTELQKGTDDIDEAAAIESARKKAESKKSEVEEELTKDNCR